MNKKIPKGWKKVKLGEVADIGSSKRIFYKEYVNTGIPFYRSKEIIEKHHRKEISTDLYITEKKYNEIKNKFRVPQEKDILLTSVGTLGIPYIVRNNEKFYFKDGNLTWFRNYDKDNLFYKFLYYWLLSPIGRHQLFNSAIGSTQPALTIKGLKQIEILLPPLPEQRAIAEVLSSLDDKIDLLHRQNKTLEQMAQTLFRKWFIEEAKEDWEEVRLEDFLDFKEGPGIRNWQYVERGIPFINIRLIQNGEIDVNKANFISEEEAYNKYRHFFLQRKDMVISTSGTLGKSAIIRNYHLPLLLNTSVIRFRPKDGINYSFMYGYLKSREFYESLITSASGSVQLNFGPTHLKQIIMKIPPEALLKKFRVIVDPIYEKLEFNYSQIRTLENLRDTLLPKLMSGQVRVKY